eukprot:TRINITY_DN12622_c0_g1_i1.p1 TRINITY_DN12622_c0_g1~~TRINITY_DN12622_c0_g1_i1.p1  ORF type:complete len:343 (+),score=50.68 TRINITY_DN12622_c0_g1_i1:98-1126(+)
MPKKVLQQHATANGDLLRKLTLEHIHKVHGLDKSHTLWDLVSKGVDDVTVAEAVFRSYIEELKGYQGRAVAVIVDQWNALCVPGSLLDAQTGQQRDHVPPGQNSLAVLMNKFSAFDLAHGFFLVAVSSSFRFEVEHAGFRDRDAGDHVGLKVRLDAYTSDELEAILHASGVPAGLHDAIARETGRLPGEVARLLSKLSTVLATLPADAASLPDDVVGGYRVDAVKYFTGRIKAFLDKAKFNDGKQDDELRRFNAAFAQRIFSGHTLKNPPELWQNSGLVVSNVSATLWHLVCPAVQKAVVEHLSNALVLPDIISVLVCPNSAFLTSIRRQTIARSGVLWSWL